MANVAYPPFFPAQILDGDGQPVANGSIRAAFAGSDVPAPLFTPDGTALGSSVTLNSSGEAVFCLRAGTAYKLTCLDAQGATVWTRDNVRVTTSDSGMANPMEAQADMIVGAVDGQPERLAAPANASFLRSYKNSDNVPVVKWSQLKAGANVTITDAGTQVTVAADTQTGDHKVKVDALDSEAGYLVQKLYGGTMVNVSTAYDGDGYEHLQVDLATAGSVAGDVLTADGNGGATFSAPAPQPGDHKTAVDGADASPDYLAAKLAAGSGISLTNTGSAVEIAATAQTGDHQLLVSATDAAAGYLGSKLTAGANVTLTPQTDGDGVQTLEISAAGGGGGGADWGYAPYGQPLVHSYFAFNTSYGTRLFGGCLPQTIKSFTLYPRVSFNTAFGAYGWFFVALYDSSTNALITPFTWANHSGFPDKDVAKPITLSYDSSATIDRNKDYFVRISFRYISANPGSRFCSATAYFDTNYSTQGLCGTYTRSGTIDGNAPSSATAYTWGSAIQSFPWFSLNTFPGEA